MWLTGAVARQLPALDGTRIAAAVHVDVKTAVYLETLADAGADIAVVPANPETTRSDVAEFLSKRMTILSADTAADEAVDWQPTHTLEMGADISAAAAARGHVGIKAAVEVTRTGINRLRDINLPHPVFDLDRVPLKNNIHNRYAVGLSTWNAFMSRTNLSLHGNVVVVVGYGEVGSGLASAAKSFGARVLVAEESAERRVIAEFEGYEVGALSVLAPHADVLVTATGHEKVISADVMCRLQDGCFLLNAGHSSKEIDRDLLGAGEEILPQVTSHRPFGGDIFLVAGGHIANLVAGDGDSLNAFDLTAALMVASVGWATRHGADHTPGIHPLPTEAWQPAIQYY
ncbi:NAD(P)-dependent oxidoreductase [Streptomyces sp. NPDC047085]|uniref:NAD(P)-dependent oxidoreductase n=1 Tax=Streptomyces sp. NPDC047085 TaxID=3155140 RepID=UPI0033C0BBE9